MDWLKMLGTTEHQMQDDWLNEEDRSKGFVASRKRMSMRPGDRLVYYATGIGSVFAIATVTSFLYKQANAEGFEWGVDVELQQHKQFLHEGLPLEVVSVDGRDLRQSIRRQSHIKLRPAEFEAAAKALAV
jgi:hypothetical protein